MFVWMKRGYLCRDDTAGPSLDETSSTYKSGEHTNLGLGCCLKTLKAS